MSPPDEKRITGGLRYFLKGSPFLWLLDPTHPAVRLRTLIDIYERDRGDREVREAAERIDRDPLVEFTLSRLADLLPAGEEEAVVMETEKVEKILPPLRGLLAATAPFTHPVASKGAGVLLRFLEDRFRTGDTLEGGMTPLLFARLIDLLFRTGVEEKTHLLRAIGFALGSRRKKGGWSCVEGEVEAPCPLATVIFLRALSHIPDLAEHWELDRSIDFLLGHVAARFDAPCGHSLRLEESRILSPSGADGLPSFCLSLSGLKKATADPRFQELVHLLLAMQDEEGRWRAAPSESSIETGAPGEAAFQSRWLTLASLTVIKRTFLGEDRERAGLPG